MYLSVWSNDDRNNLGSDSEDEVSDPSLPSTWTRAGQILRMTTYLMDYVHARKNTVGGRREQFHTTLADMDHE